MTIYVHIEPADERRRDFARWCLSQSPRIETASASGSDVPLDLYPSVPHELLEGAYVDGYPYRSVDPVPAAPPAAKKTAARKRSPRKASNR